ncbi:MAG TPA: CHASE2 domain-containing protein [Cyclobacteriaceae bacterium]
MTRQSKIFKVILTIVSSTILSIIISYISEKVNVLEKFTVAINDVDFTDLYYQYKPRPKADENIVIVNIGYRNRTELAEMLKVISINQPKVIGGDIFFDHEVDTVDVIGTNFLSNQVKALDNLVLASAYGGKTDDGTGIVARQSPMIREHVKEGIVNLNIATDDPEYGTVRSFYPVTDINKVKHLSFGFLVASFLDSTVLKYATEYEMMIRWYGYGNDNSDGMFKTFDSHQILNGEFEKKDIEGKIVLLGFMGETFGDYVPGDIFFTPLNKKIIGRSLPDMYGVEVHANVIKMIVDKDFIYHSKTTDLLFNLILITIFTLGLFWIQSKYYKQYSILSKIALIIFVDILIVGAIGVFWLTSGDIKFLIADGLFVMLFVPDTYEFLDNNLFAKFK